MLYLLKFPTETIYSTAGYVPKYSKYTFHDVLLACLQVKTKSLNSKVKNLLKLKVEVLNKIAILKTTLGISYYFHK